MLSITVITVIEIMYIRIHKMVSFNAMGPRGNGGFKETAWLYWPSDLKQFKNNKHGNKNYFIITQNIQLILNNLDFSYAV